MKKIISSLMVMSFCFILSSCVVVEKIADYNIDNLTKDNEKNDNEYLELPESSYEKKTLELSLENFETLNPLDSMEYSTLQFLNLVYDSLYKVDENYELKSILIDRYEKIGTNTYKFYIKQGINFHNGVELKAIDIEYSYNYIVKQQLNSPYSYITKFIQNIKVLDNYAFEVTFNQNNFYNFYALTFPIVSKKYVESKEYNKQIPIGTGLYEFDSSKRMLEINLKKVQKEKEIPEYVKGNIVRETIDSDNMFKSKRIDMLAPMYTNWNNFTNDGSVISYSYKSPYYFYIGFNVETFNNINNRKKLARDIPYDSIKKDAFLGNLEFATIPLLAPTKIIENIENYSFEDYNKKINEFSSKGELSKQNIRFIYNSDNDYQVLIAKIMKDEIKDENIKIEYIPLNKEQYKKALENKDFDIYLGIYKMSLTGGMQELLATNTNVNYGRMIISQLDTYLNNYELNNEEGFIKVVNSVAKSQCDNLKIIPIGFLKNGLLVNNEITIDFKASYTNVYQGIDGYRIKK